MKVLGLPSICLGIEIIWKRNAVNLGRDCLVGRLLDGNNMAKCKPKSILRNTGIEVRESDENTLNEKGASSYRSIIDRLLYIDIETRPNLCVAASSLGLHVEHQCDHHIVAAKHVLKYLKGTLERLMKLEPGDERQLSAYVDSNWGLAYEKNCRSRTRVIIQYDHACV